MPVETLEPPVAPAAAPAAAPAQPAFTHPPLAEPAGSEAFGDLESLATDNGQPEPAKPDAAPEKPRAADGKFTKPEPAKAPAKAPEKPVDKVLTPETPQEKMAPKQLREAYEGLKRKQAEMEAKYKELETKASKPADDPEKKTLAERLAAREQRLKEVEDELRFTDYSKSEEYKQRFEKPFVDAYVNARARVAGLKTVEKRNELEEVTQASRQGTAEDFDHLMKIGDDNDAAEWATERFGNKAPIVLSHRERVQELNHARNAAVDDYRAKGSERDKARAMEQETMQKSFGEAVEHHTKAAIEKYPQWFKPDETDAKGNEILERGQHMVKRVLSNGAPLKEGEQPMTPAQYASAVAAVRNKAAAFDRLAHRHNQASSRIKALEAELAAFKGSEPGKGEVKGGIAPTGEETPEGAFDKAFGQ
jgi:hypothetical protein